MYYINASYLLLVVVGGELIGGARGGGELCGVSHDQNLDRCPSFFQASETL